MIKFWTQKSLWNIISIPGNHYNHRTSSFYLMAWELAWCSPSMLKLPLRKQMNNSTRRSLKCGKIYHLPQVCTNFSQMRPGSLKSIICVLNKVSRIVFFFLKALMDNLKSCTFKRDSILSSHQCSVYRVVFMWNQLYKKADRTAWNACYLPPR